MECTSYSQTTEDYLYTKISTPAGQERDTRNKKETQK